MRAPDRPFEFEGCGTIAVPAVDAALWLAWRPTGLCALSWLEADSDPSLVFGQGLPRATTEVPEPYASGLASYLAGDPFDPATLPVDLEGTPFQRKVWQALRRIPFGQVRSYASIARDVGSPRAMRAVGGANGK